VAENTHINIRTQNKETFAYFPEINFIAKGAGVPVPTGPLIAPGAL
jgi:hypothetical protein